jgi:uncharacterized protein (DUF427 family)
MTESVWDYPRPPRLEPVARRLRVEHRGVTVADAGTGWRVLETSHPPVFYLPPAAVRTDLLVASDRRTVCEFKGVAHYWDLVLPDLRVPDVAWSYPEPTPSYVDIAGALAFYAGKVDRCLVDDEEVTPQASDFYGGWVTREISL